MEDQNSQFGMTQEDVNAANRNELIRRAKSIFASIAPAVIKLFSTILYYLIKFIKAFVSTSMRMVMGKE